MVDGRHDLIPLQNRAVLGENTFKLKGLDFLHAVFEQGAARHVELVKAINCGQIIALGEERPVFGNRAEDVAAEQALALAVVGDDRPR